MSEHMPRYEEDDEEETRRTLLNALVRQVRRLSAGPQAIVFRYDVMGLQHIRGLPDATEVLDSSRGIMDISYEQAKERSLSLIDRYRDYASELLSEAYCQLGVHFRATTSLPRLGVHAGIASASAAWHEAEYPVDEAGSATITSTIHTGALLYRQAELYAISHRDNAQNEYTANLLLVDDKVLYIWDRDSNGAAKPQPIETANYRAIADLAVFLSDIDD
jgi:hypothetical protein